MRFRSPRLPGGRWTVRSLAVGAALLAAGAAALVVPTTAGAEDVEAQAISHRVPFPCGQTWQGQTRTNHSPLRAIDFNRDGDFGDRVTASAAGTVVHRGKMDGTSYGRLVVVRHSNGTATYYAHLSEYRVQHGEQVSKGETLGLVGGSGFPNTPAASARTCTTSSAPPTAARRCRSSSTSATCTTTAPAATPRAADHGRWGRVRSSPPRSGREATTEPSPCRPRTRLRGLVRIRPVNSW